MKRLALLTLIALLLLCSCSTALQRQHKGLEALVSLQKTFLVAINNQDYDGNLNKQIKRVYLSFDQTDKLYGVLDLDLGDIVANFVIRKTFRDSEFKAISKGSLVYASNFDLDGLLNARKLESYISEEDSLELLEARIGIKAVRPQDLSLLGISSSGLDIADMEVLFYEETFNLKASFLSEQKAKSFSTILKAWYIASLRLDGISFTISEVSKLFDLAENKVSLKGGTITPALERRLQELLSIPMLKESL